MYFLMRLQVNTAPAPVALPDGCLYAQRHVRTNLRTTVRLENYFWAEIDRQCKQRDIGWQKWVEFILSTKPVGTGSASWLRVNCLLMTKESK